MVETVRSLCKEKGVSVFALEQSLGLGNGTIRKWDKQEPSASKIQAVAEFFGVSMEYIMTGENKQPVREDELSREELTLLSAFRSLPSEQQDFVLLQLQGAAQALTERDPGAQGK